jgi:hypothetical protein
MDASVVLKLILFVFIAVLNIRSIGGRFVENTINPDIIEQDPDMENREENTVGSKIHHK